MSGAEQAARDLIDRLIALDPEERGIAVRAMTVPMRRKFAARWAAWAHAGQYAPPGDWRIWLIRAGRGFGKTRAGAEWVAQAVRDRPDARIALVGATREEARRVMVEGPSGVLAVARADEAPTWRRTAGEVHWPGGAIATVYSADVPDALRGPEHHAAWCDELAKWRRGDDAWDNLMLTMRLGERPRVVVTTTPRPTALMRRVMALPGLVETRGATRDNPHLPASFVAAMEASYGRTMTGRQELEGELIDAPEGALWPRALIERQRGAAPRDVRRIVIGVDPPAGTTGDACGIVAVALDGAGHAHVLEDASVAGASPERWARAVADCAARHGADRVVAEANQGGAMVGSVLSAAEAALPITLAHATRGKARRAEPVAALYEAGRAWHAGAFPALEDEMCGLLAGGGYEGPGRSPDRADALVWAMSALMLGPGGRPTIRTV